MGIISDCHGYDLPGTATKNGSVDKQLTTTVLCDCDHEPQLKVFADA
jgi:hypothetical protein